jgi:hypothetical protein
MIPNTDNRHIISVKSQGFCQTLKTLWRSTMGVQRLGQATYLNIGVYLLNTSHLIEKIALALLVARGKGW